MFTIGDIILVHRKNWFASLIRTILRKTQEDEVSYSHVAIMLTKKLVLELIESGVRICDINVLLDSCEIYKVVRYKYLSVKQKDEIGDLLSECMDTKYDFIRLILRWRKRKFHICSSLIAYVFWVVVKLKFNNTSWESVEPDDIDDETIVSQVAWKIILKKEKSYKELR
jgi:uncharacterized protein YycO